MERQNPQQERPRQNLRLGQLLRAPEKGPRARSLRVQQSLDVILLDRGDDCLGCSGALCVCCLLSAEDKRPDLAGEGVDEEGDVGALDGAGFGVGGGEEVRGVCVCEELGDDAGFGDYGAIVRDCRDETALFLLVLICLLGYWGGVLGSLRGTRARAGCRGR